MADDKEMASTQIECKNFTIEQTFNDKTTHKITNNLFT